MKKIFYGVFCLSVVCFACTLNAASLNTQAYVDSGTYSNIVSTDNDTSIIESTASSALNLTNYVGTASATATFGTLRASASATVTDYSLGSYSRDEDIGDGDFITYATDAAYADAWYIDTLSVGNLQTDALLHFTFTVDGIIDLTGSRASGQWSIGVTDLTPFTTDSFHQFIDSTSTSISNTVTLSLPVTAGVPMNLSTRLLVDVTPSDYCYLNCVGIYSASMLADFSNTVTLTEMLLTDLDNNPINGITFQSESGTPYPISSINTVPIPPAFYLFGSGLLGLLGISRSKKAG